MSHDADYLIALEMQKRWNADQNEGDSDIEEVDFKPPPPSKKPLQVKRSNPRSNQDDEFLNRTQNLVHPQWETLDPTPDIFSLFGAFNLKFFQSRLKCVTLEWSKRMYSCAGICYSRRNRYGMDVTIRLSEPLLKLRPRKDLVETMLHEMIHAYCFVLNIREGNGGHGPNFKKIMVGINKVAGTNITVYHTFHDEVELYKQHWWRCNGSCQHRSPFFGYVKRTCNRAPSTNDQWWAAHQESCGGTFMKIKGPEKTKKENAPRAKKAEQPRPAAGADLRKFFSPKNGDPSKSNSGANINGFGNISGGGAKGPIKSNGGGTLLLNPKTKRPSSTATIATKPPANSIAAAFPPTSYPGLSTDPFNTSAGRARTAAIVPPGGNLRNVRGFRDLNDSGEDSSGGGNSGRAVSGFKTTTNNTMSGQGYSMSGSGGFEKSRKTTPKSNGSDGQVDRNHLRDIWAKRFGGGGASSSNANGGVKKIGSNDDVPPAGDSKRRRLSTDAIYVADETEKKKIDWIVCDEDVMLHEPTVDTIALSSDDDDGDCVVSMPPPHAVPKPMTADERQTVIKKEIIDDSIDLNDEDITLIDDEYDDNEDLVNLTAAGELADTSIIDEFFGDDVLLNEFERENDVRPTGSRHVPNPDNDIITCPICQAKMKRTLFAEHLDGCTGIAIKVLPRKSTMKKLSTISREVKPTSSRRGSRSKAKDILRKAGYSEQDLANLTSASSADDEEEFLNSAGLGSSSRQSVVTLDSPEQDTRLYRQRNILKTTRQCPVCAREIEEDDMNRHLDECLNKLSPRKR